MQLMPSYASNNQSTMQVLLPLLPLLLPVLVLIVVRRATPAIKAWLATLNAAMARPRKPTIVRNFAAAYHHLLVRASRMPSMTPSAVVTGGRYHTITSAPSGHLWRALRHNLASGVAHPAHLHRHAAARRHALRGLVADLKEQLAVVTNGAGAGGVAVAAGESIHGAVFGLAATMCFGYGVDAGVVRAMADVQSRLVLSLSAMSKFVAGNPFLAVSRLIHRKQWNKLAVIRRQQEELFLPLIDGCRRRHRRRDDSDDVYVTTPSYVHTLLDLDVPVESSAVNHDHRNDSRKLEDGELVGLCSEFLGQVTESTAAAVQWIMANLIKHPDVQEAVRAEIDAAVDADADEVGEGVLEKLDHLNAVILEGLRLHPTIMCVFRQVMEEDHVVHDGQRVATGTDMMFLLEALGRDKAVWAEDPDEFKPERFHGCGGGESTAKNLLSMATEVKMMPFGVGRRMCPAVNVSLLHIGYFVANLVREFVWEEVQGGEHAVQLKTDTSIFFFNRMARPLRAHLVPRRPVAKKI